MTRMLASVSNCFEVDKLLTAQVDIIDLKDPSMGALGAVSCEVACEVVKRVNHRKPVSATIGDLQSPAAIDSAIRQMSATGVDIIKVGIFTETMGDTLFSVLQGNADAGVNLVLVFFADIGFSTMHFHQLSVIGIRGVMLDTANKHSGSLTTILDSRKIENFVSQAHQHGLWAGLAGSLQAGDIEELLACTPDYLGFRGAICCERNRNGSIDIHAVNHIRQLIPVLAGDPASRSAS